ncbi:MAG TPA: dihydrolipoamide acetyltransferase family protein [Candidatus Limnocylindria bacterium]|nr:dihydrolipoamide acetyltransferase family protein [Candidatus Limnocylindria bacterium]
MATTIKMPQLGESVTEGTIERWLVKEGDTVEQYDPLFEVVTDKVNAEVPAEVAGTVSKILVGDGETVAVGTPVAEIETDGAGAAAAPSEGQADAAAAPAAEAPPAAAPAAEAPAAEAQPEPAQPELPADAGPAAVEQQEQAPAAAEAPAAAQPAAAPQAQAPAQAPVAQATAPATPSAEEGGANGSAARMTPAVRRLVREHGIDVNQVPGTGAGGRITRDDVLAFIQGGGSAAPSAQPAAPAAEPAQPAPPAQSAAAPPPAQPAAAAAPTPAPTPVPAPAGGDTEVPLSQMRKGIARKMTTVKTTVPHAYTVVEVDMTNVVRWREGNNAAFKAREGASLSYVAVVVKAVTETLRKHPTLNSQFAEDKIILKQAMNIGIAVAVDNGLIVPVIHNADQLSISGVNAKIRDLSARAHSGKLRLDELQGGTFTVNNTGWFGSVTSMPIINAPEVAILSMEAIVKRPRVIEVDGDDVIAIRHMMNMTCSFDHRVLDGAQVGSFMADVRKVLEDWDQDTPIS